MNISACFVGLHRLIICEMNTTLLPTFCFACFDGNSALKIRTIWYGLDHFEVKQSSDSENWDSFYSVLYVFAVVLRFRSLGDSPFWRFASGCQPSSLITTNPGNSPPPHRRFFQFGTMRRRSRLPLHGNITEHYRDWQFCQFWGESPDIKCVI